jgi:thiol-disulfide isomerase/thioredoxin
MPFGAVLYIHEGTDGSEFLKAISKEFPGKALFLNFWAPWCRPCMEAMPSSKITRNETLDLPLEYIYICTDRDVLPNTWIATISVRKQPGLHIFASDLVIRDLWKSIGSGGGYPTYIFIDKNGKFIPGAVPLNSSTNPGHLRKIVNSQK